MAAGGGTFLAVGAAMRQRTDRLYPRPLGPRELEALRLVEQRPGITVEQLAGGDGRRHEPCVAVRRPARGGLRPYGAGSDVQKPLETTAHGVSLRPLLDAAHVARPGEGQVAPASNQQRLVNVAREDTHADVRLLPDDLIDRLEAQARAVATPSPRR